MSPEIAATYRVQLNQGFTLDDARRILDYLEALGISHLYCSPYLQAAPGSVHGYDVVDPQKVNAELGGETALIRLVQALQEKGMGQVLDIVPNHMAITGPENPWWWDVLENGPSSRYADYFDVDWDPPETRHSNEVLVPVLGDHYGRVLEAGDIQLFYADGKFTIHYFDNVYPVDPRSLGRLLEAAASRAQSSTLAFVAGVFDRLPSALAIDRISARRRYRDKEELYDLLRRLADEQPEVAAAIEEVVAHTNRDPDALDVFLGLQNYRLAFWRMAQRELGYRRFFDINSLIGLRMEDEQVFIDTHTRVLDWLARGWLDGLRIDHPDGLLDPEEYFFRLNAASPKTWLVIEKIVEPGERLPPEWPVAGTTGYDFMYRINNVLVDPAGEKPLTDFYARFTHVTTDYPALVRDKKIQVINVVLGSDLNRLAALFLQITERHRRHRDYGRSQLRDAIVEVAACMPVYRTYVRAEEGIVHETDVAYIQEAVAAAKVNRPDLEPALFDFFKDLLLLNITGEIESDLVMRFQQFTGPAMAKGVEDTTFYNFYRLVSLNEVGGNPGQFGILVEEFHHACAETQERWPRSMLATSTHDTKRSEDVRARLDVLSEIPELWVEAVSGWAGDNDRYRTNGQPDRNDEYLLYQTLVGAWPIEIDRVLAYMEKAAREAKVHSSWTNPDPDYERALAEFVKNVYADREFMEGLEDFVDRYLRTPGWINSLTQTLLKLTTPGIPDIYQGNELWTYSLVDPDNRRPVDYDLRRRLLAELQAGLAPEAIWERAGEGLPKLWVIHQALRLRRELPGPFGPAASYQPLPVSGNQADRVLAFTRRAGAVQIAVVVPLLVARESPGWGDTAVELPPASWHSELTGERLDGGSTPVESLIDRFPVCLLSRQG